MLARLARSSWIMLVAGAVQGQKAAPPTLVLTGGRVFTADSARPWAEAVAIRGDRIVAVGSNAEMGRLAGPETVRRALGGRVVVPGFNDAHTHLGCTWEGVTFATGDDPVPEPTIAQVADSIAAIARRVPAGTWIGTTVNARILDDPTGRRVTLDRVAPRHPVRLETVAGHGAIFNSAALTALGITDAARDPVGGRYERDPRSGRLTGLLEEYAEWNAAQRYCSARPEGELVAALRAQGRELASLGITSVQVMADALAPAVMMRVVRNAALPLRVRIIPMPVTTERGRDLEAWDAVRRGTSADGRITVSGTKWILDGSPIERIAAQRLAYADRPGYHGRLDFPVDTIRAMLAESRASGQQLMLHAVGDSTIATVLTAMERSGGAAAWRDARLRIEHGDGMSADLRTRARALGVLVVQNPSHLAVPTLQSRFVPAVWRDYQPLRSLLTQGIPLAIGSDGPTNPFLNVMLATLHPNHPSEALTREQAVTAYTRGSAYAEGAERVKGTIAPGMLADLAVLSQNVFTVAPDALPATTSVLTILGGRVVHDALAARRR